MAFLVAALCLLLVLLSHLLEHCFFSLEIGLSRSVSYAPYHNCTSSEDTSLRQRAIYGRVKDSVCFSGNPNDLRGWVFSIELAIRASEIWKERAQVDFATSFLQGHAFLIGSHWRWHLEKLTDHWMLRRTIALHYFQSIRMEVWMSTFVISLNLVCTSGTWANTLVL